MVDCNPFSNKARMSRQVDVCMHVCDKYTYEICDQTHSPGIDLYLYCDALGFQKCQLTIPYLWF